MELVYAIAFICVDSVCSNKTISEAMPMANCISYVAEKKEEYKKIDPFVIITCEAK